LDDVRIVHNVTIGSGEAVVINSVSIESAAGSSTTIVGTLTVGGFSESSTSNTTSLTLQDRSSVAAGSRLQIGQYSSSSSGTTTSHQLVLGNQLTIHGDLDLYGSASLSAIEGSAGRILVSESGRVYIQDGAVIDLPFQIVRGGSFSWLGSYSSFVSESESSSASIGLLTGTGQIDNQGSIEINWTDSDLTLDVDVTNSGEMDLRYVDFGSSTTTTTSLIVPTNADVTIASDGKLVASIFGNTQIALNNNTLDVRQGELSLFVDPGTGANGYGLTLVGGVSAVAPALIQLEDTDFSVSARTVALSATGSGSTYTLTVTVSEVTSSQPFLSIAGGSAGSLGNGTINPNGSVTYSTTLTRDEGNTGNITVTVADDSFGARYGGVLTINGEDNATFVTNTLGSGTLNLTGHTNLELTGFVDFVDADDQSTLILDASDAGSIKLSAGTVDTAGWVNSGTLLLNNLTVDTGVILANAPDPNSTTGQSPNLTISGTSVINGDLYNLNDPYNLSSFGRIYLTDDVALNGLVLQEAGTELVIGLTAGFEERATTVTFANDFTNEGKVTVGDSSAENHSITVGSAAAAGRFINEGEVVLGSISVAGVVTLDGRLDNEGQLSVGGGLVLDATQANVTHQSSGIINFEGAAPTLTLGASDTLQISSSGYLGGNGFLDNAVLVDATATGALLEISGYLAIGDQLEGLGDDVIITTGIGDFEVQTSAELVINSSATVAIEATFGASSATSDSLRVTTPSDSTVGGILRLNGGRLALTGLFSAAGSVATIASAANIVGSFGAIDGLILGAVGTRTVADVDQTQTLLTLTPLADTNQLQEGSAGGEVFDFSQNTGITHYLAADGDDLVTNIGFGDTAYGEKGDDVFVLDALTLRRIDGGEGIDQVILPDDPSNLTFDLRASAGWLGHSMDRIEVLNMDDSLNQTLRLDEQGLRGIIDEASQLLDGLLGLVVEGNAGDVIELTGSFEFAEDRYLLMSEVTASDSLTTTSYQPELFTGLTDGEVSLYFDQDLAVIVSHENGGVSRYGNAGDNTLTGTGNSGETISGRAGDDILDGGAGSDIQLGGAGNDRLIFDAADVTVDGGNGVDTLSLSGSVDFTGLDNLSNIEQLDMSGNGTADELTVTFEDLFDLIGDNSLEAYVQSNEHKVIVINGDSEDSLILEGQDVRLQTPTQTGIDLYGDGTTYALFQDTTLGLDVYVLSSLLASNDQSSAVSEEPAPVVIGVTSLDQHVHQPSLDAFGGL
jgi:hypothetical protein